MTLYLLVRRQLNPIASVIARHSIVYLFLWLKKKKSRVFYTSMLGAVASVVLCLLFESGGLTRQTDLTPDMHSFRATWNMAKSEKNFLRSFDNHVPNNFFHYATTRLRIVRQIFEISSLLVEFSHKTVLTIRTVAPMCVNVAWSSPFVRHHQTTVWNCHKPEMIISTAISNKSIDCNVLQSFHNVIEIRKYYRDITIC